MNGCIGHYGSKPAYSSIKDLNTKLDQAAEALRLPKKGKRLKPMWFPMIIKKKMSCFETKGPNR